jgi:hypothetical protein
VALKISDTYLDEAAELERRSTHPPRRTGHCLGKCQATETPDRCHRLRTAKIPRSTPRSTPSGLRTYKD